MRVNGDRDHRRRVSEPGRDDMDRHARRDQVRRVAVPDVWSRPSRTPALSRSRTNASVSRWRLSGPPSLVAEDQITIATGVAGQRAGE